MKYLLSNGYVMIGYDAIRHTYIGHQAAVNAGCWLGANVMLYKHEYVGTASGTAVLPFYTPGESFMINSSTSGRASYSGSATASAYGTGGYAYGSAYTRGYGTYNSTTTTTITSPGSFSYYSVPYSHDYYDQYAVYFVKKYHRLQYDFAILKKANVRSNQVGIAKKNVWFELISKQGNFLKIKYQGIIGYIPDDGLVFK